MTVGKLSVALAEENYYLFSMISRPFAVYSLERERSGLFFEPDGTEGRYPNVKACLSGEYSCFSGNPTPYTVVADEDSIIMEIPKSDLHNFISINPKNAEEIFGSMAQQLAMISKHIDLLNNEG